MDYTSLRPLSFTTFPYGADNDNLPTDPNKEQYLPMTDYSDDFEDFDDIEIAELWTPPARARVSRKPKKTRSGIIAQMVERATLDRPAPGATARSPKPKPSHEDTFHSLVEEDRAKSSFSPTFGGLSTSKNHVSNHEREWIFTYLGGFYEEHLITDVIRRVKSGKEATVYCCAADPRTGADLLAGKVYHERMFRSLKNDSLYREGKAVLDDEGKEMRGGREKRAILKGTSFGQLLRQVTWLSNEFSVLQRLHAAGADVPRPVIHTENAMLMEYVGDRDRAALALVNVRLPREEARPLFDRLMWNIDLMFANGLIHGDLSAHNILYWEGAVKIIDFPQAVAPFVNPNAYTLLVRDVKRVCEYFSKYGISSDPEGLTRELWNKYVPS